MSYIYIWHNTISNKLYVGQTIQKPIVRKNSHLFNLRRGIHSNKHLQASFTKYGESAFEFDVIEELASEELDDAERFWMAYFRMIGVDLYNDLEGGNVARALQTKNLGSTRSIETRRKLSESMKINYNRDNLLNIGKKGSEASAKVNAKTYDGFVSPEGIVYANVTNLRDFARRHNVDHRELFRLDKGIRKSARGWTRIQRAI